MLLELVYYKTISKAKHVPDIDNSLPMQYPANSGNLQEASTTCRKEPQAHSRAIPVIAIADEEDRYHAASASVNTQDTQELKPFKSL